LDFELPHDHSPLKSLARDKEVILEEYRVIVAERRFIMTRYMQSMTFYVVVMGYSFAQFLAATSISASIVYALFMLLVNTAFVFGARNFRKMAYHAINREAILARRLGVQYPYPMMWGYQTGIYSLVAAYILVLLLLYAKIFHPFGALPMPPRLVGNAGAIIIAEQVSDR